MARKPYDAEVEYIQASGAQYIDPGVVPTALTRIVATGLFTGVGQACKFGCRDSGTSNTFGFVDVSGAVLRIDCGSGSGTGWSTALSTATKIEIDAPNNKASITSDGGIVKTHTYASTPVSGTTKTFWLFRWQSGSSSYSYDKTTKLASLQIYVSGTLVRDFQPVRVGTVGALYDRVGGALFTNRGTGYFIPGTDIAGGGYSGPPHALHPMGGSWKR